MGKEAFTCSIQDCTAVGFTDGKNVLLMHITPYGKQNRKLEKIEQYMESKLQMMNKCKLHAILVGSLKQLSERSAEYFDKFVNFLERKKIEYSAFRDGLGVYNLAYQVSTDEWIINDSLVEVGKIKQKNPSPSLYPFFVKHRLLVA